MENARENTLSVLADLINICKEEYQLFKTASLNTTNPYLKSTLENCAEEKFRNMNKLMAEIERLGGKMDDDDVQMPAKVLEEIRSVDNDSDILTKCEKIDDIVLSKYSKAMNGNILWEVIPLVAKQYFASVNLHDRIMYLFKRDFPSSVYS